MTIKQQLTNSTGDQHLLRAATRWAAEYVLLALPVFEDRYPEDARPREAVDAALDYVNGEPRGKRLRVVAMAAFKIGKDVDEPSKCVTKATSLLPAVAYTHTDLRTGQQGMRQARHILGPVVYSALAIELAERPASRASRDLIRHAIQTAPTEVRTLIQNMPPQEPGKSRADELFHELDSGLRALN